MTDQRHPDYNAGAESDANAVALNKRIAELESQCKVDVVYELDQAREIRELRDENATLRAELAAMTKMFIEVRNKRWDEQHKHKAELETAKFELVKARETINDNPAIATLKAQLAEARTVPQWIWDEIAALDNTTVAYAWYTYIADNFAKWVTNKGTIPDSGTPTGGEK